MHGAAGQENEYLHWSQYELQLTYRTIFHKIVSIRTLRTQRVRMGRATAVSKKMSELTRRANKPTENSASDTPTDDIHNISPSQLFQLLKSFYSRHNPGIKKIMFLIDFFCNFFVRRAYAVGKGHRVRV